MYYPIDTLSVVTLSGIQCKIKKYLNYDVIFCVEEIAVKVAVRIDESVVLRTLVVPITPNVIRNCDAGVDARRKRR